MKTKDVTKQSLVYIFITILKLVLYKNNAKPPIVTQDLHDPADKHAPKYGAESCKVCVTIGGFASFL